MSLTTGSKVRSKMRAFDLGSQCRRAGMDEERMVAFYAHERGNPDYDERDLRNGWWWQQREYERLSRGDGK